MNEGDMVGKRVRVFLKATAEDVNGKQIASVDGTFVIWDETAIILESQGGHSLAIPVDNVALVMSLPEAESEARP
jgi:hypothetical protein